MESWIGWYHNHRQLHRNVYGLVDNDFDRIQSLDQHYSDKVVSTGTYDLIADLVMSSPDVLRRVLSAHAAPSVSAIEVASGSSIDNSVFDLTSKLAAVRLATAREKYPLTFKGYNFTPMVGSMYEPANLAQFLEHAACRRPDFVIDATVLQAVEEAFEEVSVSRHASGGHDIVSASHALLRNAGSQVSVKTISGTLISVASCHVMATLSCLVDLTKIAGTGSAVELLNCVAA